MTLTLISSVITAYVTLLDLDAQLRIAKATVGGRRKIRRPVRNPAGGGWISEFEMSQVRGEYEIGAGANSSSQAGDCDPGTCAVGPGRTQSRPDRSLRRAGPAPASPVVPAGLPSELLAPPARHPCRPNSSWSHPTRLIGAARALFFPRISLTGLLGLGQRRRSAVCSTDRRDTWSFTGDVAGPIYTGGGLTAAVDQADGAARPVPRQLRTRHPERVPRRRGLARRLAATARELRADPPAACRYAPAAGVELANERYDNGYSDYLEVLDTERSLFSAELQLASARGRLSTSAGQSLSRSRRRLDQPSAERAPRHRNPGKPIDDRCRAYALRTSP